MDKMPVVFIKKAKQLTGILQNYCRGVNKNLSIQLILLLFISPNVFALPDIEQNNEQIEQILEQARQLKLSEQPAWLNLLHYKDGLLGERQSQADDRDFFLASSGAVDALAELEADIRGFFSQQSSGHPQCRFPARLHWLNSRLSFKASLPEVSCNKFDSWKEKLDANQVTLLFPSMYLENPASMFGHTFIRFDAIDNNHLLSLTLSYAAATDKTDSILMYSWKGITGGYTGQFFLQPYFQTLIDYSDIEQRDIWEYSLNLNKQEIDQLVRHLWEVNGISFEYFFMRENCSFRLLALLDVARENINMSADSHPIYAIPVDTVRDIEQAGLIKERFYRPSRHNKTIKMAEQVEPITKDMALSW